MIEIKMYNGDVSYISKDDIKRIYICNKKVEVIFKNNDYLKGDFETIKEVDSIEYL